MELAIAMVYGQALFDAALDLDKVDEIKDEITAIDEVFKAQPRYSEIMGNPALPAAVKKSLLREAFEGRVMDQVLSFLFILVYKGRFGFYHSIVKHYLKLMDRKNQMGYGKIYSAVPLTEEQIAEAWKVCPLCSAQVPKRWLSARTFSRPTAAKRAVSSRLRRKSRVDCHNHRYSLRWRKPPPNRGMTPRKYRS